MAIFKIAAVFSDNMVLQRNKNIALWGQGEDGKTVSVSLCGNTVTVPVEGEKWLATLPPMSAGGPYEVTVSCGDYTRTFTNVMIGEVWLCGGQSNMELELQNCDNGKETLATDTKAVNVRFYYTNKRGFIDDEFYRAEENSGWGEFDSEGSRAWSAVGYFFARKLARDLGVTVGLIGCNWGGTSASAWMSRERLLMDCDTASYIADYDKAIEGKSFEQCCREYDEYCEYDRQWNEKSQEFYKIKPDATWEEVQEHCGKNLWPGPMGPKNPYRPAGLYETMVKRVMPYTLAGFLYYQGESDDHKPDTYYKLFRALIDEWREGWGDDELPFICVQLPMFKYAADPDYKHWCKIREAQMRVFETVKNTGIAVILDKGEFNEIHPKSKQPVGERLCLQAERLVYGIDCDAFAPTLGSFVCRDGKMELTFRDAKGGFDIRGEAKGFEIAGRDKKFFTAAVEFDGDKATISAPEVAEPMYARYNWFNYAEVTVFGKNGIPLAPFRTSRNDE